jgi:hypothetical protein
MTAAELSNEFANLALSTARRWTRKLPHLTPDAEAVAALALWRFALRWNQPVRYFAYNARRFINVELRRFLDREFRHSSRRAEVDLGALRLTSREPDPAFVAELAESAGHGRH